MSGESLFAAADRGGWRSGLEVTKCLEIRKYGRREGVLYRKQSADKFNCI